jgi:aspartate/tyrosine/aromatic aminotransferase
LFLAYRDENGKPWVLPFVLDLENKLLKADTYNHEYLLFLGMDSFNELVPRLILGENSPALKSGRVSIIQQYTQWDRFSRKIWAKGFPDIGSFSQNTL